MKTANDALELLLRLSLRPVTGKAAYCIVLAGISLISPSFTIGLLNLVASKVGLDQLPVPEAAPTYGSLILILGFVLVVINHLWAPRHKLKEVIGIRHNSLGSFPQEDVRKDLPLLQRLDVYREINVDHSDSYAQGVLDDHKSVIRRLERVPQELSGLLTSTSESPIAYYGLPHVPLAFYLGYLLSDNKYRVDLYDLNNQTDRWNQLSGINSSFKIHTTISQLPETEDAGDIIVTIGISYPVHASEITELRLPDILATVEINAPHPQRQLISNHDQIDQICAEFRRLLEAIKNHLPNSQRIHIFYAGPVSLCFALGRSVSERIDPEIVVYNYSSKTKPRYSWGLSFNAPNQSSAEFLSKLPSGSNHAPV